MKKYVAHASVLGLNRGDTFSSDDPFYANIAKSGIIKEVVEDGGSTPSDQHRSVAESVEKLLGEGDTGSGKAGGRKGKRTLPE